ncbi:CHAP domain-containing protein [Candidatus Marithrix sp. Canyon 246]|uniref:CHAP domain-containing protein n=1 Tax=Candidatus Marithrix sp. Canyon 246 TaxID=1827136 RepID=UPI00084A1A85|nr:CHAP domain-containing protein [Candidatus Marithrix sp. Canyon 246]
MKLWTQILLLGLLAINPITSMASSDDSNNCQTIYLPEKEILHVPCIDIVTKDGDLLLQSYAVDMQLVPNTDPLQFIPQNILEVSWDGMNAANCRATYTQENGTISIPCIEVPKLSEDGDYAVGMKQVLSENSSELPQFIITNIKQQTKQVEERSLRSSTRSATSFSTGRYENNQNINRTLSISGVSGLEVEITGETERNYDWITIYDSNGQEVRRTSGPLNVSFTVNGSSIRVNFSSDGSVIRNGATVSIRELIIDRLSPPNLVRPANNTNNVSDIGQTFNWNRVNNANTYRIVVSTTSDFSGFSDQGANSICNNTCFTAKISSTSYSGFNLAQGTSYYWRVRTGNNSTASNWSTTRQFTVARTTSNQASFSTGRYENNQNINRTLSISGASSLQVQITGETERNYDWISIYDSNGQQVRRVSGPLNVSFTVSGSSIRVNFSSDGSITKSGATVTISSSTVNTSFPSSASVDSFVQNKTGTCTDMDGSFGCQCVDLMHSYIQDVLGVPRLTHGITGHAYQLWSRLANVTISSGTRRVRLEQVQNTPNGVPQKGDIIFWRSNDGIGHVAIFIDGNVNDFRSLDQNWINANSSRGSAAAIITHNYNNVVGWLHPVLISN